MFEFANFFQERTQKRKERRRKKKKKIDQEGKTVCWYWIPLFVFDYTASGS